MAEAQPSFNQQDLTDYERDCFEHTQTRILELRASRVDHYGVNLDTLWSSADMDYVPHRLKTKSKKMIVTDEDKGWRGAIVNLGSSDWQSDVSQSNPFVKIQTALSILIDQNPTGVFTPTTKRYQATTELLKQLYERSWEIAKSRPQLELFVFNLAKYGWACARTYPLRIVRKVRVLTEFNQDAPEKSVYEDKEVVEYNDIMRENLDPRNVWIDDMTKPNNALSIRDWCWRKVYDIDVFKSEFGKYKNAKFVQPGGVTTEVLSTTKTQEKPFAPSNKLVEVFFYENRIKDEFIVIANGVPVLIEPLPISDAKGCKKLSLWQTFWNLRHAESPYGIGIYEAIRFDQALLDRIRNMTIDQLTLSIYKMFFYQGTQSLTDTGDITISPGVGKQVLDPKNVQFLEVPGPGQEAWVGIEKFREDVDEASGVGDPLTGNVTGKTAFEIAQARESALKRLKSPLNNILEALNQEGYITVSLIQLLYSIPETYKISDPQLIDDYLKEIGGDPSLFERGDSTEDGPGDFTALVYPEFPLNLSKDEGGNLVETDKTEFFRLKPGFLEWEGIVNIKSQSLLTPSKQIDKALKLEMYNILIPLLQNDPNIYALVAQDIVKTYDEDPRDILPPAWLVDPATQPPPQAPEAGAPQGDQAPLFTSGGPPSPDLGPQNPAPQAQGPLFTSPTQAPTLAPQVEMPTQGNGIVGKLASYLAKPFR